MRNLSTVASVGQHMTARTFAISALCSLCAVSVYTADSKQIALISTDDLGYALVDLSDKSLKHLYDGQASVIFYAKSVGKLVLLEQRKSGEYTARVFNNAGTMVESHGLSLTMFDPIQSPARGVYFGRSDKELAVLTSDKDANGKDLPSYRLALVDMAGGWKVSFVHLPAEFRIASVYGNGKDLFAVSGSPQWKYFNVAGDPVVISPMEGLVGYPASHLDTLPNGMIAGMDMGGAVVQFSLGGGKAEIIHFPNAASEGSVNAFPPVAVNFKGVPSMAIASPTGNAENSKTPVAIIGNDLPNRKVLTNISLAFPVGSLCASGDGHKMYFYDKVHRQIVSYELDTNQQTVLWKSTEKQHFTSVELISY